MTGKYNPKNNQQLSKVSVPAHLAYNVRYLYREKPNRSVLSVSHRVFQDGRGNQNTDGCKWLEGK